MVENGVKIIDLDELLAIAAGYYFPIADASGTKRISWDTLKADPELPQLDEYRIWEHPITGSDQVQLEIWRPGFDQSILRLGPENDWPDDDSTSYPKEATLTFYLSRVRWYDCFVDVSLNRLSDPTKPKFVTFLRGDGLRVPLWQVQYKKDDGSYTTLLECDPDGDDHRFIAKRGSVVYKMSETGAIDGLTHVDDSGDYYVDGSTSGLPWAENGSLSVRINPYATSQGMQVYQSFADTTHRAVRTRTSSVWSAWRTL